MIDEVKEAFDKVSDKPNFGDEPKNFTSRMMWFNYALLFVTTAMLIYVFFFTVPRSQSDDCREDYKRLQVEYNGFLKNMIPQVQQNKITTDSLQNKVEELQMQVQKQNPIVELYNKRN